MPYPAITNWTGTLFRRQLTRALDWLEENSGGGGAVAWGDVTGKPSTFTPSAHTHAEGDVTGLTAALAGKAASTHSHAVADVTGLQTALDGKKLAAPYQPMVPAAGEFIANGQNGGALGTAAQVANRTVIVPYIPMRSVTIDQLGLSVSTFVASANLKCIIYASDANGRPSTVLRETANIDAGSNGTKFASITSLTLEAGTMYWIGLRSSSTATVRALSVGSVYPLTYTNAATPLIETTLILTETFANAAATWTYAASQHSNVAPPLILMRVA
jgi:hypothetical protein